MIADRLCATCVFFAPSRNLNAGKQGGQCRRNAPIGCLDENGKARSLWPLVWSDNWCGEHGIIASDEDQ